MSSLAKFLSLIKKYEELPREARSLLTDVIKDGEDADLHGYDNEDLADILLEFVGEIRDALAEIDLEDVDSELDDLQVRISAYLHEVQEDRELEEEELLDSEDE